MKCPHCGEEITEKQIAQALGAKGGKVSSKAKTKAARRNAKKRWEKEKMKNAITEAMEDFIENDRPTPHNPAILKDKQGRIYYGSALHDDAIVLSLEEGFGSWTPERLEDIPEAARRLAEIIES